MIAFIHRPPLWFCFFGIGYTCSSFVNSVGNISHAASKLSFVFRFTSPDLLKDEGLCNINVSRKTAAIWCQTLVWCERVGLPCKYNYTLITVTMICGLFRWFLLNAPHLPYVSVRISSTVRRCSRGLHNSQSSWISNPLCGLQSGDIGRPISGNILLHKWLN